MIVQLQYSAYLRQIFSNKVAVDYSLSVNCPVVVGKDANCQVVVDAAYHSGISGRHIEIRPVVSQSSEAISAWQVCDLASYQGTCVNGHKLQGCQTLKAGDRISLGQSGVQFIFECQPTAPTLPGGVLNLRSDDTLRFSQLVPFFSTKQDLLKKAHLIPGIITVLLVVALLVLANYPPGFNAVLSLYLISAGYYFIYRLCGKAKPWWLLVGSAIATMLLLCSPVFPLFTSVFREILPGDIPNGTDIGLLASFIHYFFGAGLLEELFKALPVFAVLIVGRSLKSPQRERMGIWEPLDGIIIATASAAGFTLLETMGQYVPDIAQQATAQFGAGVGELSAIQLLIPRIIGSVAGHMAYSGYFGYFIGLSVLKPSKRWSILIVGYLTAATLHALWNASPNVLALALVGVLSYAFLMAAILKARQLSPVRSQNWATQYFKSSPTAQAPFLLQVRHRIIPLTVGTQLRGREIVGIGTRDLDEVVATINASPKDPSVLGLQNCSAQIWTVTLVTGQQKQLKPSRSIKLAVGTKIDFGSVQGIVQS